MLESLTIDDFTPLVDTPFEVAARGITLRLTRAAAVMESERARLKRQPFSLFFRGPADVMLPQGIHTLRHEAFPEDLSIFLVPVGRAADAFEYEAVFT